MGMEPLDIWPPLWQSDRKDSKAHVDVLERLGWPRNPFGPERTEDDPGLHGFHVEPPDWSLFRAFKPSFLVASSGCGQTATLWLLVDRLRLRPTWCFSDVGQEGQIPFTSCLDADKLLVANTRGSYLNQLSAMLTHSLLDFLARNPHAFAQAPESRQIAISQLVVAHEYNQQGIIHHLEVAGLGNPSTASKLARAMVDAGKGVSPWQSQSESDILRFLKEARLNAFRGYVFVADISSQHASKWRPVALACRLQPLADLLPDLVDAGVILKVGIPAEVGASLKVSSQVDQIPLNRWPEEILIQMLQKRLDWAVGEGGGALTQLFGPDRRDVVEELVAASVGSPRQLVRLGNELLVSFGQKGAKLTSQDLAEVIARVSGKGDAPPQADVTSHTRLREKLVRCFDMGELKALCADLAENFENVRGDTLEAKAGELITYFERRGRLRELLALCHQRRPLETW